MLFRTTEKDDFLLVTTTNDVLRIELSKQRPNAIQITDMLGEKGDSILSMDYDAIKKCLYYSELNPARIMVDADKFHASIS